MPKRIFDVSKEFELHPKVVLAKARELGIAHHVFGGADHGSLFTHSAGLVAAHPIAHHLAQQSDLLKWLLRREAFLRFGFDPERDFVQA
jgi:hypothetical protein